MPGGVPGMAGPVSVLCRAVPVCAGPVGPVSVCAGPVCPVSVCAGPVSVLSVLL